MRRSLTLLSIGSLLLVTSLAYGVCGDAYDPATGRINVGLNGRNFTVFGAAGFSDATSPDTNNTFTGPSFVQGNIGIGPKGTFSWSDGTIDGNIYMSDGPGSFTMSGPAHFAHTGQGVTFNNDLSGPFMDYQNLSNNAADCGATTGPSNINITNASQSMSITGGPNQAVVLSLQNFVMSSGTFTLQGTATTTFIINIKNQFSLNNAKILLANMTGTQIYNGANPDPGYTGVTPSNVLFNIRSKGIQISLNQGTQMSGILLALGDKISLSGGKVYGKAIGGQVNITSGGQVISR
jgi:hypothetical protein